MRTARESGVQAPLLDRLVAFKGGEHGAPDAPYTSVLREACTLLSTRCALSLEQAESLAPHERSVLDYGLPDLWSLGSSPEGARRLERLIARAVEAFEPRLEQLRVSVQLQRGQPGAATVTLTARLARVTLDEPLSVSMRLDRSGRLVEVSDGR